MLSHILYHRGEEVNVAVEEGHDLKKRPWYNNCVNKRYDMPARAEWGKAWLCDNYDYQRIMEFWHLDAGDTTHVMENLDLELKFQARTYCERPMANELTYVLKFGNLLGGQWKPDVLRQMILSDEMPKVVLSMLSAKAENSKHGKKSRDILATADTVREPLTEIDKNTGVIAADISGPVFHVPATVLTRRLMEVSAKLVPTGHTIATFRDVSSWSAEKPRAVMYAFSELLMEM
ncbi:unnamed protein product [Nippostrongylus brasiliensis]|uniref:Methyltransferase n=1 Tax=Nippostrongylus brasiliensis TaxID=27835 RepID=A0A0N4XUY8_NIPBR|nr:unnamed protein product [Nippostrongylus brasiliensis]